MNVSLWGKAGGRRSKTRNGGKKMLFTSPAEIMKKLNYAGDFNRRKNLMG